MKLKEQEARLASEKKKLEEAVAAATRDAKASADRIALSGLSTAEYLVDITSSLLSRALEATYVSHFYLPLDGAEIKLERHIIGSKFELLHRFIRRLNSNSPSDVLCLRAVEPNGSLRWSLEIGERDNLVRRVLLSNAQNLTTATDASVRDWVETSVTTMTSRDLATQSGRSSSYVGFEIPKRPVAHHASAAIPLAFEPPRTSGPTPGRMEKSSHSLASSRGQF